MEDREIVGLYFARDERALSETDGKYRKALLSVAENVLGNPEDGEESLSDAYLKAWNSIPPQKPENLLGYLCRLVRAASIDLWRKRKSEKRGGGVYDLALDELEEAVGGGDDAWEAVKAKDLAASVDRYLATRSRTAREVFLCRYFFADSIREIASYTGFGEARIKSMLHRTREGLREHLRKEGYEV